MTTSLSQEKEKNFNTIVEDDMMDSGIKMNANKNQSKHFQKRKTT